MKPVESGFTLLELMIVLAIAGILVALATPSFTATVRNNRLSSQANEFIYALKFARTEAIKRGVPVTLCRSTDTILPRVCTAGGVANWEGGWIIIAENAGNLATVNAATTYAAGATLANPIVRAADNRVLPAGTTLTAATVTLADTILVAHEALSGGSTLRGNNNIANNVLFNSQGMTPIDTGTIVLCDVRGNGAPTNVLARADAREIVIAFSGQTRLTTPNSRRATNPVTANPATCTPP